MDSNKKPIDGRTLAPCSANDSHHHLYHPWWSVKEMQAIASLAHHHRMLPVELIRAAAPVFTLQREGLPR